MWGRVWSVWRAATRSLGQGLDLRGWTMVVLMTVWLLLNVFDLLITYDGLSVGVAFEANRVMNRIIRVPAIAASVKMSLAYCVIKLVERVENRTPYSGLMPLLAVNVYLAWACLHNLNVLSGIDDATHFLKYYPLTGLPK